MKRSEMATKLSEFLTLTATEQGYWPTSDEILDFLENEGMLPPLEPGCPEYDLWIPEWEKE